MTITLDALVPTPLADKLAVRQSDIWHQQLTFEQPAYIKIVAPSGTGKSTLMHQLYGLRNDYTGSIKYGQQAIAQMSSIDLSTLRQRQLSIVFQDMRLLPQLTALENIQLKRAIHPPACTEANMYQMIETLGISNILQQNTALCSYGEQQRIAIVRALMQPFHWLLMDEPFSHLDNNNTAKAVQLIQQACRQRSAGFILTDLEPDTHFNYTHQYHL